VQRSALPEIDGFSAFKVGNSVKRFQGYGMGSYSARWRTERTVVSTPP